MLIFAQTGELTVPDMPSWSWGANWGLAGGLIVFIASLAAYVAISYWQARRPHLIAKWAAEASREASQSKLFDVLSQTEPMKMALLQQNTEMLSKIDQRTQAHFAACDATGRLVEEIQRHLGLAVSSVELKKTEHSINGG